MKLRELVRASKDVTDWGKWQQVKMPPRAFPLSRRRGGSYRLSYKYTWRVVLFDAVGASFRLLLAFRTDIQQFEAILGLIDESDTKVIASYEFHGSHPGWHLHANCDSIESLGAGFRKSGQEKRLPKYRQVHRRLNFDINEGNALAIVSKIFQLPQESPAVEGNGPQLELGV